jgi:CDP-2,3-bis-(O-geranylgeranyl)-sn-glycerol synthase
MIQDILFVIWFLLPAAAANAAPVFAAAMPYLRRFDAPIDGGRKWHGERVLGSHKTWRGIIAGIFVATFVLWCQVLLVEHFSWTKFIAEEVDYSQLPVLLLGPLFAVGALGGDMAESFFKRRRHITSGKAWIPFDQLDYIIGSVLVSLFFVRLTLVQYGLIFVIWFLLHLLGSYLGYKVKLKKDPV